MSARYGARSREEHSSVSSRARLLSFQLLERTPPRPLSTPRPSPPLSISALGLTWANCPLPIVPIVCCSPRDDSVVKGLRYAQLRRRGVAEMYFTELSHVPGLAGWRGPCSPDWPELDGNGTKCFARCLQCLSSGPGSMAALAREVGGVPTVLRRAQRRTSSSMPRHRGTLGW